MGLLVWVLLLACITTHAVAQRPHPCKSPPFLQGSMTMVSEVFHAMAKYSYDAFGQRIRFGEHGDYENKTFLLDVLLLYKEGVMYKINHHNRTCTKNALKGSFHPLEIPCNATLLGQVALGSLSGPGEGLLVNSWYGEIPKHQVKFLLTFTETGCIPVTCLYNKPKTGWITTTFFNNIVGVKDPSVFIPPPYCTDVSVETGESEDFFSVFTGSTQLTPADTS